MMPQFSTFTKKLLITLMKRMKKNDLEKFNVDLANKLNLYRNILKGKISQK